MFRVNRLATCRGLTLIEVMVALGVLVILVGGIFLIVQTSLKTVLDISNSSSRNDEITNLADILRSGFRNLPVRASVDAELVGGPRDKNLVLMVRNAPGFLTWLMEPEAENTIVLLSVLPDTKNGGWRICLKRYVPPGELSDKDARLAPILRASDKIPWLELVGSFKKITARFYDGSTQKWLDDWRDAKVRPALIELRTLSERTRDERSETSIFWVPPIQGSES